MLRGRARVSAWTLSSRLSELGHLRCTYVDHVEDIAAPEQHEAVVYLEVG